MLTKSCLLEHPQYAPHALLELYHLFGTQPSQRAVPDTHPIDGSDLFDHYVTVLYQAIASFDSDAQRFQSLTELACERGDDDGWKPSGLKSYSIWWNRSPDMAA